MKRSILIAAAALAITVPAIATGYNALAGHYSNNARDGQMEVEARVTHVRGNTYNVSLSTLVAGHGGPGGCGGGVDGQVTLTNGRGTFTAPNEGYDPANGFNVRFCEVSMRFGRNSLQLQELRGCSYYHGAQCEFRGRLTHDAAGI